MTTRSRALVDGDGLTLFVEEIIAGTPQTGNTPEYALWRTLGPNRWWNAGGGAWQVAKVWNALSEPDSVNRAGWYEDTISSPDVARAGGEEMQVQYRDVALAFYEYEHISVVNRARTEVWDALEADATTVAGSMGELFQILLGLGFRHYRQFDHTFSGSQMTGATIRVYKNNADLLADVNHLVELFWTTSYAAGKPNESACTT